jgi:hypothetical protein
MSKVNELIAKSLENGSGRVTKNMDEYLDILVAVLTDNEYVTKDVKEEGLVDGEFIFEERRLAPGFKKIIIAAFRKAGMSEQEATDAAENFKLTKDMAKSLMEAVRETDYIVLVKCGKKIQFCKKPGLEVNLLMREAKESLRPNPKDKDQKVRIKPRQKIVVQQKLHRFQKEFVDMTASK